ncbi:hypothetical protein SAMN05443429_10186 [Cruoricaptor ignavus]|uniref:Uncharacterized protein n=2 Tax=Cruoricaptor ignavus TaxID=1118202 RepID=A0A1M6A0Q8_9FLAO|nr:hypothetical protein SAMN05443429_10186 [Cruoricaptor ignavus]
MQPFSKNFKFTMTVLSVFTMLITSVMDLNETHMTNPLWPPHARFHWAAQYFSTLVISILIVVGIWSNYREKGTKLSVLIIGLSLLGFWGMFIPALLMPGTSTAPDGFIVPENFPKIFTIIHPNFIISVIITFICIFTIIFLVAKI